MFDKKFNSKYAVDMGEIYSEAEVRGMGDESIYVPPRHLIDDQNFGEHLDRPLFSQLTTITPKPLNRRRIRYVRPDKNISPDERDEKVIVDPGRSAEIFEDYRNRRRPQESRARLERSKFNRHSRHQFNAFTSFTDAVMRNAYPCTVCGGQKNGGNAIAPRSRRGEQKYCRGCLNRGYQLLIPHAECKGEGCDRCSNGKVKTDLKEHFFNFRKKAAIRNIMVGFHEKYCGHLACDLNCPLNAIQEKCSPCKGTGEQKKRTCARCKGKGTIGRVDLLRAEHFESEEDKQERQNIFGDEYTPEPLSRKHTHSSSGSSRRVVEVVGPMAVRGDNEDMAPQFLMNHPDAPISVGDPVLTSNYDHSNPDAALRKGERQEVNYTYNENAVDLSLPVDDPNPRARGLVKAPHRQEPVYDLTQQDAGYMDKQGTGIVSAVTTDGRKIDIASAGRPIKAMRDIREEQLKGAKGDERRLTFSPNVNIDTTRGPTDTERTNYRNDQPGMTTREAVAKTLTNAFARYIHPNRGECSTHQGFLGKTLRGYPADKAVRLNEITAHMHSVAGTTIENIDRSQIFPAKECKHCEGKGCSRCKGRGRIGGTGKMKAIVIHIIDLGFGPNGYRRITNATIDPEARQHREQLGRELDRRAGIEHGSPLSLVDAQMGGQMAERNETGTPKTVERIPNLEEKENQTVFMMPQPRIEVPGILDETGEHKPNQMDTAERSLGRTLTNNEKETFQGALESSGGHFGTAFKSIGGDDEEEEDEE